MWYPCPHVLCIFRWFDSMNLEIHAMGHAALYASMLSQRRSSTMHPAHEDCMAFGHLDAWIAATSEAREVLKYATMESLAIAEGGPEPSDADR